MFSGHTAADMLHRSMQTQQGQPAVQEVYVELIPLTYSGAVPSPMPACTDPTPDEQHRQIVAQKQEALKQKEDARQQQTPSSGGGMLANLKNVVSHAAMSIEKGAADVSTRTEAQVRQLEYQRNCDRFRLHFPELAQQGEVLLADYGCTAMHGGQQIDGHMQITRHYLCFFAETSSNIAKATDAVKGIFASARQEANGSGDAEQQQRMMGIRQAIPLSNVASVQLSVALETVAGAAPYFLLLPAPTVRATALQLYATTENKLFQFFNFESLVSRASGAISDSVKGTALERAYNYLDHAWREAIEVPLRDVEYA